MRSPLTALWLAALSLSPLAAAQAAPPLQGLHRARARRLRAPRRRLAPGRRGREPPGRRPSPQAGARRRGGPGRGRRHPGRVLEIARLLSADRGKLHRDVYFVTFSGEESGVLGSTAFTRNPPGGLKLADLSAMLNLDMVGRMRNDEVTVFGTETAAEWNDLIPAACDRERLGCKLSGDGYGPSDHSPFYAAGVPVLHVFTGTHEDYHKPSDTADKINAVGGERAALLVADFAREVTAHPARLAYKSAPAPAPQGDARSYGASLGTIPDYAGDGRPGVLLGGVRPESGAAKAGLTRGDLLVELSGKPIRDIYDFMFVLRQSKPGETTKAIVDRAGKRLEVMVTFGTSSGIR